jgi:DNA repair exonuclease SbcCD ATPase subunit
MMKLISLTLHNFQGVSDREILMDGNDVDVFGANGVGKTTNFDAFTWDLWGKDSRNNKLDKDIKFKGDVDHGLEHTVMAVLELDSGKRISLKRIFAENWTKKKGSAVATFSGHTTNFEIDGVPVKEKEYQAQINEIIDENKFKMLTDPLFFQNQLHWQDRRKLLIEVCGDVKDADVIASSPELQGLLKLKHIRDFINEIPFSKRKMGYAMEEAIKAVENQPKYNLVFELMATELTWKELKEHDEEYDQMDFGAKRTICINKFKRQAGLEVPE